MALAVFAAMGLVAIVSLARLDATPPATSLLGGTWLGDDGSGGEVVYHFGPDDRGYRVVDREREEFAYTLVEGYPDELRLRIRLGDDSVTYRGLVQLGDPRELRLEVGGRGEPPPYRITERALRLHHPPAR